MRKRILSLALALCLVFAVLPVSALATEVSGSCGTGVTWKYDDATGALSITGVGAMKDYASASSVPWFAYRDGVKSVTVGNSVTSIGDNAFYYCNALSSVTVGTAVKSIGSYAFRHCSSLTTVALPPSVKTLDPCAFFDCTGLTGISISGVQTVGDYAFYGCTALASVTLPATVTAVGGCAFYNCSSLAGAVFDGNPPTLGAAAFDGCADGFSIYYSGNTKGWDDDGDAYWNGYPVSCESIKVRFNLNGGLFESTLKCTTKVSDVNDFRLSNELVVYSTGGSSTGSNSFGSEAIVDSTGLVTAVRNGLGDSDIPNGGFVLSGHGTMKTWIDKNITAGLYISFEPSEMAVYVYTTSSGYLAEHKTVTRGAAYGALPTPSRAGYTFDGWFTLSGGGELVGSDTVVTASTVHTLHAHWSRSTDPGMSNFSVTSAIYAGFADVNESEWYGSNMQGVVKKAVSLGIMQGYTNGTFAPESYITLAEAIKMAAVVNSIYSGKGGTFVQGEPWYQVYVDYSIAQGIFTSSDFSNYTVEATRAQMAYIFANCIPTAELTSINNFSYYDIPDVTSTTSYASSILLLYRAGVLTGAEDSSFSPYNCVTRAQAAAFITRIALTAERKVQGAVSGIAINYGGAPAVDVTLYKGSTLSLVAVLSPVTAVGTIEWKSGDEKIAKVDANGLVTAVGYGNTMIHATCGGLTANCIVRVK